MATIGLIDVDSHNYPNLPLMKLSAWHKAQGDNVEWYTPFTHYDIVYMSKVFSFTPDFAEYVNADKVVRGGTGYALHGAGGEDYQRHEDTPLPEEIEHIYPDYSLYRISNTAYGFLTRGCPRGCDFCIVGKKEGRCSRKVADLNEFWDGQKNIVLNDPNILACREWKDLLQQLIDSRAWVDFNQGLDIRLMTEEKAAMLSQIKIKEIHFAWDRYEDKDIVLPKLRLYANMTTKRPHSHNSIVYVLVNHGSTIEQDLERIYTLRDMGYWAYVMVYDKANASQTIRDLQRWCNNRLVFATCPRFEDYNKRLPPHQPTQFIQLIPISMPQQDPALALLEMHRSAHAALQQSQHSFATVHVPTAREISDEYADRRVRLQANRELTAAIPAAKRLNIIYAPLLAKTLCSDLCETISGFLRDNHITDTKEDNKFFRLWRETWEKELYSPDMPQGAETVIRTLTQRWRDDGTDNVVKSLRYAYTNALGKHGIGGNTADFLAWILTARDIARASAKFDDASLSYLRSIPQSAPYHLRRNTDDYAYKLQEFCTRLVKSAFGNDYDPADTAITTGRKALFNRLALYDAATALAEYWAKEGIRKAGKQCPAERCKACELHDHCKTLKSTTKKMHQ